MNPKSVRKLIALAMVFCLAVTTVACGGGTSLSDVNPPERTRTQQAPVSQTQIPDGTYGVQQATYNDGDGEYTVFLLNTPAGVSAAYRSTNLQMAQLTPEEVSAGKNAYLKVEGGQAALHIPQDFKVEYVHNVVQTTENPQTGQTETRVVRQESNFWTPFAGALAGQIVGNLLFTPRYYVPPVYQPGISLSGYGGYGNTYGQAVSAYQQRYQQPPAAVRNRTVYRSTGRSRTSFGSSSSAPRRTFSSPNSSFSNQRSTGRGFGSSNLRPSNSSNSYRRPSSSSFGSGRSSSFGSSRSSSRSRRR